jgi:hypothetical protein
LIGARDVSSIFFENYLLQIFYEFYDSTSLNEHVLSVHEGKHERYEDLRRHSHPEYHDYNQTSRTLQISDVTVDKEDKYISNIINIIALRDIVDMTTLPCRANILNIKVYEKIKETTDMTVDKDIKNVTTIKDTRDITEVNNSIKSSIIILYFKDITPIKDIANITDIMEIDHSRR